MSPIITSTTTTISSQSGGLVLRVERRGKRTVMTEAAGHIPYAARSVPAPPGWARVVLVQTVAGPLAGDVTTVDVHVGAGARLELTTNAATLAYPAASLARHDLHAWLGAGARFAWSPGPLILAAGCDLDASVEIELGEAAAVLSREVVVLGRHGESAGRYRSRLRFERDDRPLFHDTIDLDTEGLAKRSPAILAGANVFASLALVGIRPQGPCSPGELDLAESGRVLRALAADTASLDARIAPVEAFYRAALEVPSATFAQSLAPDRTECPAPRS